MQTCPPGECLVMWGLPCTCVVEDDPLVLSRKERRKLKRMTNLTAAYARIGLSPEGLKTANEDLLNETWAMCPATFTCDPDDKCGQETDLLCELAIGHVEKGTRYHQHTFHDPEGAEVFRWPEVPDEHAPDDYLRRKYNSWLNTR